MMNCARKWCEACHRAEHDVEFRSDTQRWECFGCYFGRRFREAVEMRAAQPDREAE